MHHAWPVSTTSPPRIERKKRLAVGHAPPKLTFVSFILFLFKLPSQWALASSNSNTAVIPALLPTLAIHNVKLPQVSSEAKYCTANCKTNSDMTDLIETGAPTELPCFGVDRNGHYVVCDSEDGTYPSDILGMGHFLGIFIAFIAFSGGIAVIIMYCNKVVEQRGRNRSAGK